MNRVFSSKWNAKTRTWVAVSETTRARSCSKGAGQVAAVMLLAGGVSMMSSEAIAACSDTVNSVFASGGSSCNAAQSSYSGANVGYATDAGSVLTFTAPDVTVVSSDTAATTALISGGTFNSVGLPPASVHALGNLNLTTNAATDSVGLGIVSTGSSAQVNSVLVDGNLVVTGADSGTTAVRAAGNLQVKGKTTITTAGGDGYFALGEAGGTTASFGGDTNITTANRGRAITMLNNATLRFQGDLRATSENATAIYMSGSLGLGGNFQRPNLIADRSTFVRTSGDSAIGVDVSAADASFSRLLVSTIGASAMGVQVTRVSNMKIGAGSRIATAGSAAQAVYMDGTMPQGVTGNTVFTADNAELDTIGPNAAGILVTNGAVANLNSVTLDTTGFGSPAILALNGGTVNAQGLQVHAAGYHAEAIQMQGGNVNVTGSSFRTDDIGAGVYFASPAKSTFVAINSVFDTPNVVTILGLNGVGDMKLSGVTMTSNDGTLVFTDATSLINLAAADQTVMTGNVVNAAGGQVNFNLDTNSQWTGSSSNLTSLSLANGATWNMTGDTTVDTLANSGGTVNFVAPSGGVFKTLTTNSISGSGGLFKINTVLNEGGAATQTDLIKVNGDVAGANKIAVTNAGGLGAQTAGDGIRVVQVGGNAPAGSFALNGPLQAGAYEYQLVRGGTTGTSDYFLRSELAENPPVIVTPPVVVTPPVTSYRPAVPGYLIAPYLARDYGYAVGTLHEREGDQDLLRADGIPRRNGTWARVSGQTLRLSNRLFGYDTTTGFIQAGADLYQNEAKDGTRTFAGVMLRLGNTEAHTSFDARAQAGLNAQTGTLSQNAVGVGGYFTRYGAEGTYVDVVGELTRYQTSFTDSNQGSASQTGYGALASVEIGMPVSMGGAWKLEPQAQLAYQHLKLKAFSDSISSVSGTSDNALRSRLGMRMFKDASGQPKELNQWSPYLTLDLTRDLTGARQVTIGSTTLDPDTVRNWWSIGGGLTTQFSKTANFYADLKYQRAFGTGREGVTAHAGMRWNW